MSQATRTPKLSEIMGEADRVLEGRQREMVGLLESMRQERGQVLYDLTWMEPARARRRHWVRIARALIGLVEMAVVFVVLIGVANLLRIVLQQFAGLNG